MGIHQWGKLRSSNLRLLLDHSFITGDYGFEVKRGAFYMEILRELSLEGRHCIMVGDRVETDILPAKKCGITTVRVLTGKYRSGNDKAEDDAEYKIKKVEDVLKVIPQIERVENDKLNTLVEKHV